MIDAALQPGRLRLAAALVIAALVACLWALWPAPRRGLVLYATSESTITLAEAFTARTGIPVTVVRLSTGPMLARIAAEGGRPQWTLAWIDGDMAAAALDRAGLLARGVVPAAAWTPVGRALIPADAAWVPTGVTLAAVTLRRRGQTGATGMPDPAISGPGYPELAGLAWSAGGWPKGKAAVLALKRRGLSVVPTSPAVVGDLTAGRIGSALIQSSTAYALARRDPLAVVDVPRPAFMLPGVLMVARHASPAARQGADRFLAYMTSAQAQRRHLALDGVDSLYWPVTAGVAAPASLPPIATIAPVHLDPYSWGARQGEITAWFEAEAARR